MTRPRYPSDSKPRTRKPGGAGPGTTQVSAIIPLELKARLDRRALVMGVRTSAIVRRAIPEFLDALDGFAEIAIAERRHAESATIVTCWCEACDVAANKWRSRMALCPECGDKRCNRSKHHDNQCSTTRDDARTTTTPQGVGPAGGDE